MSRRPINAVMSDSALMAWLERYYPLPAAGSSGGSGTPGGSNTQVQYNNSSAFGGSSNFTFDGTDVTIVNDLYLGSEIIHNGDTDTKIAFSTNTQIYTCASQERLRLNSDGVGLMGATPIAGLAVTGDLTISGDTTLGDASGDSLTINAQTINPANITTGTGNDVVVYNGSSLVTDEINSAVWDTSATFVDASGGASTRVGVFSDSNTIAGSAELTYDGSVLLVADAAAKLKVRDTTSNYQVTIAGEDTGPRIYFGDHDSGDDDYMTIGAFSSINQIDTENRDFHLYGTNTTTGFYFDESEGYFGIGTDEPKTELHIAESDGAPQLRLSDTNATTNQGVVAYTEYWKGDNTTRIGWAGYGSVGNENFVINNQTATGSFTVMTNSTTALVVDSSQNTILSGNLITPVQPGFSAYGSVNQTITPNVWMQLSCSNEVFDNGAVYNTSTSYFTAPMTGKYLLSTSIRIDDIDSAANQYVWCIISTSNRSYYSALTGYDVDDDTSYYTLQANCIADMDANDVARVLFFVRLTAGAHTQTANEMGVRFQGWLLG